MIGFEPLHSTKLRQIDNKGGADDHAAHPPYELHRRFHRAAGCNQIVNDEDALSWLDGVFMHFDDVRAVFELVVLPDGAPRKLAFLADRNEARVEPVRYRAAYDETARLDPSHGVNFHVLEGRSEPSDRS